MKVAVIHSFYRSQEPSGENEVVTAQVDALREAGHDVRLISRSTDETSQAPLYRLSAAAAAAGIYGHSPLADLTAFQPDVIHVHNLFPNFGTAWTRRVAAPIVATAHNYRSICSNGLLYRDGDACTECLTRGSHSALIHACYRNSRSATVPLSWATRRKGTANHVMINCSRLIALNHYAAELYGSLIGVNKVVHIPNFVRPIPAAGYRTETTLPRNFVYIGRLTEEKGVNWLLQHWPEGETLSIAGAGPLEVKVRDFADSHDNVRFLGRVSHIEATSLIARAKAVVIPSLWLEGLPTVALEAYSTGTPVVFSSRLGAAAHLARGGAGVAFDPAQGRVGLAHALEVIVEEPEVRRQAALELFDADYSQRSWLDRMTAIYEVVIEENEP